MSTADRSSPDVRPTLLVGYGAFGRRVLRRLLTSTAPRGMLTWEEPAVGANAWERRLQDLAFLWVPERLDGEGPGSDGGSAAEGSSLEMMRDLDRQILAVPVTGSAERDLLRAAEGAADRLLSAAARAQRPATSLPLGLDVILLARPTSPEVIGLLDKMATALMDGQAANANLTRGVRGASALHFLEILDFDNYWAPGAGPRGLRRTLHGSAERWRRRHEGGQPAFGRIYLVDGRTRDGFREETVRIEEITLLLELMLFEGQRAGELQRLFQPGSPREALLATCGVRLIERSSGLLSRLAAARFSIGWLDYLAREGAFDRPSEPQALRRRLGPFSPAELEAQLGGEELEALLTARLRELETTLSGLAIEAADWPEQVERHYRDAARQIEDTLAANSQAHLEPFAREHLEPLPEQLREAVEADLHDPRRPVPLGAVLGELEGFLERLAPVAEPSPPPSAEGEEVLRRLAELHHRYRELGSGLVDVSGLRRWWPCFAALIAVALTPIAVEALSDLPPPDRADFLLTQAWKLAQKLAHALPMALLLFLGTWGIGAGLLQRRIAQRIDRVRAFFEHGDRGRFIDRLRSALGSRGALRAPLEHFLERLKGDRRLAVQDEVRREVASLAAQLRERQRELGWLRQQLRELVQMHGLPADGEVDVEHALRRDGAGIRHCLERGEDFEHVLRRNPPTADRFLSTQASQHPFAGWWRPGGGLLLHPLAFLEGLSGLYADPSPDAADASPSSRENRELLAVLARHGNFDLAFSWKAQEGLPPDRRYCLLPRAWQRTGGILRTLGDLRVSEENVLLTPDTGRAYLLRLQTGVEAGCLLTTEGEP